MRTAVRVGLALACLASGSGSVLAGDNHRGLEVGPYLGLFLPDENLEGTSSPDPEGLLGLRVGWLYDSHWGAHGDLQFADLETETFAGDADQVTGRVAIDYRFQKHRADRWFVELGFGATQITFDNATDFESAIVSVGAGQRSHFTGDWRFRWQFRVEQTLAEDGLRGEDLTQGQFIFGAQWGARRKRTDRDGDGVHDLADRCPDSPAGASVRRSGCLPDADGDGVGDMLDECPGTLPDTEVDERGCRPGDDRDGIAFDLDACPATPAGAKVDARGCPRDTDRDGVWDGLDQCPRTLRGVEVDERGCFLDADEDGVYDGLGMDRCPNTPKGAKVDRYGCPVDTDGDGVFDGLDQCPGTPAGRAVDARGC